MFQIPNFLDNDQAIFMAKIIFDLHLGYAILFKEH